MTTWLSKMGASALMLSISAVAMAQSSTNTITQNVVEVEVFSTLEAAVIKADLATTLSGDGKFTVFAPDDSAFSMAGDAATALMADGMEVSLKNVLLYHVVPGEIMAEDLVDGQMIETLQGQKLEVDINGSTVMIGGATVVTSDIASSNGLIHRINKVLMPTAADELTVTENIVFRPYLNTLEAAVIRTDLADMFNGDAEYTVFAPDDAAFTAAGSAATALMADGMEVSLRNVLQYHVVAGKVMSDDLTDGQMIETVQGQKLEVDINGSEIRVGGALITNPNVMASNGVLHRLNAVLMPPSTEEMTIADIVMGVSDFSTLEGALKKANLASTFAGSDEYTVFAPDNMAFTEAGTAAENLMMDGMESDLSAVLQYHVVAGSVMAEDLEDGQMIETLNGAKLMVEIDGDKVMIDGAQITMADVPASNGVIHRIDAVLMPGTNMEETIDHSDQTIAEVVMALDDFSTLEAALTQANLVATFNGNTKYTVFAPDNMAFADVEGDVNALLEPGMEAELAKVLTYHVVQGTVMAADLTDGMMVDTLNGQQLLVTINAENEVRINGALVTMADVQTKNGIIHRIDAVLLPQVMEVPEMPFNDITVDNDVDAITELKARGIIEGYPDGSYRPANSINRAEFIKIIMEAELDDEDIYGSSCFPDVNDEWYAPYICTAKRMGIIEGYPDGTFNPAGDIRMTEAYKIIAETMFETRIGDEGSLWYDKYVDVAMDHGFYLGQDVEVGAQTSREQMATMIYGALMDKADNMPENQN
ncbi:hypothetical protein GW756_04275 [bacterium]|nr:hypothetical protein [bacterium]NCQ55184.1 hypothetical protein [Candidatus Parcubacteria bacterium]NCS67303.1 hypothetical protein [Candidatus Peregrinibacteria bacterium]NCS96558.1 hypothetical protein [bacterium]